MINFVKRAFGAEDLGQNTSPDGVMHHTTLKIGDSYMEMGEAQGPYQPMPTMFYLYVPIAMSCIGGRWRQGRLRFPNRKTSPMAIAVAR